VRLANDATVYDADAPESARREAFREGRVPVAVYGLGKMGTPLAAHYADVTGNVVGADVDESVVESINAGECHVKREPGLPELVSDVVDRGALRAVSSPERAARASSIHVVIVPTPLTDDRAPDLSILRNVMAAIGSGLDEGDLVIVECTVPPRTCEDVLLALLERESGLARGEFGLAFCPERTASGRALADIRGAYPKVVGGVDEASTDAARIVYEELVDNEVIAVSDAATAEAVKVFEGLYRDVNIALANQLARYTDELGIDVREAIDVANTQPFCDIHDPGPGVGGHCIPYYPYFLIEPFETDATLLETAREVNDAMPSFTVRKVEEELAATGADLADATVLVLGLTYRPGVEEIRATPALPITRQLAGAGAEVLAIDPMLEDVSDFPVEAVSMAQAYDRELDAAVVVTPHEEFESFDWSAFEDLVIVDGRGSLSGADLDHRVYTLGSG
jgi:UDP-N-acetyl-D-mannosaminuronic acid dehydrogenase